MASADARREKSLRACVTHMLEIDASEVPTKQEVDMGLWLAPRNFDLVPVASPEAFQWPVRFLGLRRDTSTWAVYFGVPRVSCTIRWPGQTGRGSSVGRGVRARPA